MDDETHYLQPRQSRAYRITTFGGPDGGFGFEVAVIRGDERWLSGKVRFTSREEAHRAAQELVSHLMDCDLERDPSGGVPRSQVGYEEERRRMGLRYIKPDGTLGDPRLEKE